MPGPPDGSSRADGTRHRSRLPSASTHTGTSAALNLIDQALVDLIDGNGDENALMVSIPPQEAKIDDVLSRRFPEWLLEHDPELRVAIVSYELDVALRWGRDIKRDIDLAGPDLPITIRAGLLSCWPLGNTPRRRRLLCRRSAAR